jgi:glycosyltransferase involved in cell wall biosynthesis
MIDIVIASRWRPDRLVETVESILSLAALPSTNIIVSCDQDDPETIEAVRRLSQKHNLPKFQYVICPFSGSTVKAYNAGFKTSKADLVGAIPDDAVPTSSQWDARAESLFERYPEYGCLKIRTDNANGRDNYWGISYPFTFIIKRDAFERLGYLDERYIHYGADTHLGLQMLMENVLMMCFKNIVLRHDIVSDRLAQSRTSLSRDNPLFHSIWDHRKAEVMAKYEAVKHKWNLLL